MGRGIRKDLRERLEHAHEQNTCVIPRSESDARRLLAAKCRGDVVSPAPQVYALPEMWNELKPVQRERYRVRALSQLHPSWVFANVSAAAVHGMAVSNKLFGHVHVACTREKYMRQREGIYRHIIRQITTK